MRVLFIFLLVAVIAERGADAQSTIFLVRHAEKMQASAGAPDPELSERGRARAQALSRILRDAKVTAIYATEFKRTQETADALAKTIGLQVTIVPASDARTLLAKLRGATANALVVAHSNTIPDLLKGLGVPAPPAIAESDYDNLFVVTPGEKGQLLRLHYP